MPRLCSSLLLSLLIASSGSAVTMAWTPVGDPGNACDPQSDGCFGAVGYSYSIGTYEVTNAQYAEFLNAKATSDPLGLYNEQMGSGFGGITRSGASGSFAYSAIVGRENMPVNWVSWYDAVRFANWMNNGQGNSDTETGGYTLLGGTPIPSNGTTVTRNAATTIAMTSEDEWYKAAYYGAVSTSYFDYPAGSNTQTTCAVPGATTNTANCGNVVGDLTDVGSYIGSTSPYGTYDQGGNVWELTDRLGFAGSRGLRGGNFVANAVHLAAFTFRGSTASSEFADEGFRLVMIPEPSTGLLMLAGLVGFAGWRTREQARV